MGLSSSTFRQALHDQGVIFQFSDPDLLAKLEGAVQECDLEGTRTHLRALQQAAVESFLAPDPTLHGKTEGQKWLTLFPFRYLHFAGVSRSIRYPTLVCENVRADSAPYTSAATAPCDGEWAAAARVAAVLCACIYQRFAGDGDTCPLIHLACMHASPDAAEIILLLCKAGADCNGTSSSGVFPMQEARAGGQGYVPSALRQAAQDQGQVVLGEASQEGQQVPTSLDALRKRAYLNDRVSADDKALEMRRIHALTANAVMARGQAVLE